MKNRNIKSIVLLSILVIFTLIYKIFLFDKFMDASDVIYAGAISVVFGLSAILLGFRKDKYTVLKSDLFKMTILYIGISFLVMYGLGVLVGFVKNAYSLKLGSIIENVLPILVIVIFTELFRYNFIRANSDNKKLKIACVVVLTVFELCFNIRSIPFNNLAGMFSLFATIIVPITIKNMTLSYIASEYGYKIPIIYRIIMDLYVFIVPVLPDIGEFVQCIVMIMLPAFIYMSASTYMDEHLGGVKKIFVKDGFEWYDIPLALFIIVFVCLISGAFKFSLLGVGSESMKPELAKGDAVFVKRVKSDKEFEIGDVLVYKKGNVTIVHRLQRIDVNAEGEKVYRTKGDANNALDSTPVKIDQIKGKVVFKIKYIALPTVWLFELFS